MPCYSSFHPVDVDPRRWERCRKQAAIAMIAEGWKPYARKFDGIQQKRARKLFYAP